MVERGGLLGKLAQSFCYYRNNGYPDCSLILPSESSINAAALSSTGRYERATGRVAGVGSCS